MLEVWIVELVCKWGILGVGRLLCGLGVSRLIGGVELLHLGRPVSLVVPTWWRGLKDQRLFHQRLL